MAAYFSILDVSNKIAYGPLCPNDAGWTRKTLQDLDDVIREKFAVDPAEHPVDKWYLDWYNTFGQAIAFNSPREDFRPGKTIRAQLLFDYLFTELTPVNSWGDSFGQKTNWPMPKIERKKKAKAK